MGILNDGWVITALAGYRVQKMAFRSGGAWMATKGENPWIGGRGERVEDPASLDADGIESLLLPSVIGGRQALLGKVAFLQDR